MIRFVDLGQQLGGSDDEWPREFAWYNTVTSTFINVSDAYDWETWQEFVEDFGVRLQLAIRRVSC